ncbi:MAG: glycerol-3-phosphate ABC transporter ATP-binding protein [Candidatus Omnitrophica bacterium 4484_213]|nr:MAG: glycerol-3-phosphate ABC transporter ATP-binding protein [Candidatus Omnitrophica bacterium 4484_213]
MAKVILKNVSKVYPNSVRAASNVNLEVRDKEFLVLVGPSGCGKSTILRMIAGLEDVSEGEIYIGERLVNEVPPKDRDIAMVFQNYALYPHMTVRQNLTFALRLHKHPPKVIEERVSKTAEILGIFDLLDRKPRALSGGQRQRAALGRAIVREPLVFLFDEPLSNLDAKFRVQMRTEIKKLHQRLQTTMLYVTHDQIEAMTMGERIAVIKEGRVQQLSTPALLYHQPVNKFVAGFIGSPPMNFFEGKIDCREGNLYFQGASFQIKVSRLHVNRLDSKEGKEVTLGIRPEDIYPVKSPDTSGGGAAKPLFNGAKLLNRMNLNTSSKEENIVRSKLELIEPMGAETFLSFSVGKESFNVRLESAQIAPEKLKVGENIDLIFNSERCHYFDPRSEEAIV